MAVNALVIRKGIPVPEMREQFLYINERLSMEIGNNNNYKGKGKVYLTNYRLIFVKRDPSRQFSSFSMPYLYVIQYKYNKKLLGGPIISGTVKTIINGGLHENDECKWSITFNDTDSGKEFYSLFEKELNKLKNDENQNKYKRVINTPSLPIEQIFPDQFAQYQQKKQVLKHHTNDTKKQIVVSQSPDDAPMQLTHDYRAQKAKLFSSKTNVLDPITGAAPINIHQFKQHRIGLSVDGAKDVNNFRKCIEENIMPSIDSITYNGMLYEYYFDTTTRKHVAKQDEKFDNDNNESSMLFYPSYCYAKTRKLILDENIKHDTFDEYEYYISVGLNSNIKQDEFKRKHLNLVVLLDISGSMRSFFHDVDENEQIEIAAAQILEVPVKDNDEDVITDYSQYIATNNSDQKDVVIQSIVKQLTSKDRLGVVIFNDTADIIQKLELIDNINMDKLRSKLLDIEVSGGTNFEAGYTKSIEIYKEIYNNDAYDNRIIILSDVQPNVGITDSNSILSMISKYSEHGIRMNEIHHYPTPSNCGNNNNDINHIYTTFIGVGLDFNSVLTETISQARGCNYYSVNSTKDFNKKLNEEFEYMVTPLVFNVCLKLQCEGNSCQIEKVYASSNDEENNIMNKGEIVKIRTLFASRKSKIEDCTKGGIQLIKLRKNDKNNDINVELEVIFEDRNGKKYRNKQNVSFNPPKANNDMIEMDEKEADEMNIDFYDNIGIRKAILLCKYVELIKQWIEDHEKYGNLLLKQLKVSDECKKLFINFHQHFKREMIKCNDDTLQKELDIINKLINVP